MENVAIPRVFVFDFARCPLNPNQYKPRPGLLLGLRVELIEQISNAHHHYVRPEAGHVELRSGNYARLAL